MHSRTPELGVSGASPLGWGAEAALSKETQMTILPADCAAVAAPPPGEPAPGWLEKFLRALSVVTML